jgi:hypothetical protein
MNQIHTADIKLASILSALGIPLRDNDPVTCVTEERDGKKFEQYTFWFDTSDGDISAKAKELVTAYYECGKEWKDSSLDKEHPLFWMKGALENREVFLHWIRNKVVPMRFIKHGEKTVLISARASERTKDRVRKILS